MLIFQKLIFFSFLHAAVPSKNTLNFQDVISLPLQNALTLLRNSSKKETALSEEDYLKFAYQHDYDYEKRWKALILYSEIKKEGAIPELEKAYQRPEWFLRSAALTSFHMQLEPKKAQAFLEKGLSDKALVVRSLTVDLLSQNLNEKGRDLFWQELNKSHNFHKKQSLWIRAQMVKSLAIQPLKEEKSKWQTLSQDKDIRVKKMAQNILKKI